MKSNKNEKTVNDHHNEAVRYFACANQITRTYIKQTSSSSKIKKKNEEEGEDAQLSLTISGKLRQSEQINLSELT